MANGNGGCGQVVIIALGIFCGLVLFAFIG